jgi:L-threonylcarbamoyladenylate synthase
LRPGRITAEQVSAVLGSPVAGHAAKTQAPRVSGSLDAHYAPATRTRLVATGELATAVADAAVQRVALLSIVDAPFAVHARIPAASDPHAYAHGLYAALRQLDAAGCDVILVEAPPVGGEWDGVNDRLRRAAFGSGG